MPTPDFDLYLVTDRTQTHGRDLLWVLERAIEGGVRAIQLREKDLSSKDLFQLAAKTRELCDRYDAQLFVNDRIDVALAVDAAGVQLGILRAGGQRQSGACLFARLVRKLAWVCPPATRSGTLSFLSLWSKIRGYGSPLRSTSRNWHSLHDRH